MVDSTFEPSAITMTEINLDYNDDAKYRNISSYSGMVDRYCDYKLGVIDKYYKKSDITYSYIQHYIKLLDSIFINDYIKNDLIELRGATYLKYSKDKDAYYAEYQKYYKGDKESFKSKMDNAYLRLSNLKKGSPSPEFNNYRNYNGGSNSLKDFRGKYIFIDIWATWCRNCWEQMPHLQALEEKYKHKNIVFIGLSVDRHEKDWKTVIVDKQLDGLQLLVNSKEDPFIKEYAISGIPRYIIIDPDGNIVDYNAPRPSEKEKLDALFTSLGL